MKNIKCIIGLHNYTPSYQRPLFINTCKNCPKMIIKLWSKKQCDETDELLNILGINDIASFKKIYNESNGNILNMSERQWKE